MKKFIEITKKKIQFRMARRDYVKAYWHAVNTRLGVGVPGATFGIHHPVLQQAFPAHENVPVQHFTGAPFKMADAVFGFALTLAITIESVLNHETRERVLAEIGAADLTTADGIYKIAKTVTPTQRKWIEGHSALTNAILCMHCAIKEMIAEGTLTDYDHHVFFTEVIGALRGESFKTRDQKRMEYILDDALLPPPTAAAA